MVRVRAAKVAAIAQDIPNVLPEGDREGDLLIVAWGSTCGSITAALKAQRARGRKIGHLHLRHLGPSSEISSGRRGIEQNPGSAFQAK